MPNVDRIIEPTTGELIVWFEYARGGDQCEVVTKQGQIYTHLTKVSPSMVKWKVAGFQGQESELVNTISFKELLESWHDFA